MSYKDTVPHESIEAHEHLAEQELGDEVHLPLHPHVTPFWTMLWVFAILLFLTALTVWTSNVHDIVIGNTILPFTGTAHIAMALLIAVIKAILVAAFFMHLIYDKKVYTIVVGSTIFALSLFIGLILLDLDVRPMTTNVNQSEIRPGGDIGLYKGKRVPTDAAGFPGNIVGYAQEAGAQAEGNPDEEHVDEDHAPEDAQSGEGASESAEETH